LRTGNSRVLVSISSNINVLLVAVLLGINLGVVMADEKIIVHPFLRVVFAKT
jgi:hypothetical protein